MDRFLMKISVDYPGSEAELDIVRLLQAEEAEASELEMISQEHIFTARQEIQAMQVAPAVEQYIVDLVIATRQPQDYGEQLGQWIDTGSSPRASIALHRASRGCAWLDGRDHVTPEDVQSVLHAIMRHRLIISYDALADRVTGWRWADNPWIAPAARTSTPTCMRWCGCVTPPRVSATCRGSRCVPC
jgi:MoxR-like ATPase